MIIQSINHITHYLNEIFVGDAQNQVHMEGYQVSNQCQALVRDECLVPTRDAPELAYVRQSTAEKYIPDVYYKVRLFLSFFFCNNYDLTLKI